LVCLVIILVFSYLAAHYILLHTRSDADAPKNDLFAAIVPNVVSDNPVGGASRSVLDALSAHGSTQKEASKGPAPKAPLPQEQFTNVALNCKVFASSTESGKSSAQHVVDGDITTRWSSQWADPQWLVIDLGQSCELSVVEILWETAFAKSFRIETGLNGGLLLPGQAQLGHAGWTNTTLRQGTRSDMVVVHCIARSTAWGNSVFEVRVKGKGCRPLIGSQTARHQLLQKYSPVKRLRQTMVQNSGVRGGNPKTAWANVFSASLHKPVLAETSSYNFMPAAEVPWTLIKPDENAIHFVFGLWSDGKTMPTKFQSNLGAWKAANPSRPVHVWNNTGCSALVQNHFPEYESIYRSSAPIQKADLVRYMIILTYGGFYGDLDVGCVDSNNLGVLFQKLELGPTHSAMTFWEMGRLSKASAIESARIHPIRRQIPEYQTRLANYAFWCKPGCALLKRVLGLAMHRVQRTRQRGGHDASDVDYRILYTTGPDVFTEASIGIRDKDYTPPKSLAAHKGSGAEPLEKRWLSPDQVLVVDPGPLLWNGNTFSWRGSSEALGIPTLSA
jgi:hypothetical protein